MRICGNNEEDEDLKKQQQEEDEQIKQQQQEEEEQQAEEELEEEAYDNPGGAAEKFEHSMDDDDEAEDEDDKKKKKKKDDKEKDNKDDNEKREDEDDDDDSKDSDKSRKKSEDDKKDQDNPDSDLDSANQNDEEANSRPTNGKEDFLDESEKEAARSSGKEAEKASPGATEAGSTGAETAGATETAEAATATEGASTAAGSAGAAGGTAAGGATAGGTAAGGTAAGGAAAGGAAAVAVPLAIVLLVILIIIILIGVAGFFITMPQFLWNKIKKLALDVWDGVQGYVIGMDEALVNKDDIIGVAQYLYDMGYDLVGMGFAESVEIYGQKDSNGNEIPIEDDHVKNEIKKVDAPYLRAYLVAENRTYLINNYTFNLKDFVNSFFDGSIFGEGFDTWGTGLIDLDSNLLEEIGMPITAIRIGEFNVGELIKGVKIERESNTLRIRRFNPELAFWNSHFDYTYFSLAGWSGRYGKPFELMLTLHMSTMAPDLVKEFALNKDLDAKVHVKMQKTDFNGKLYVDGVSIDELEENGTYDDDIIDDLREIEDKYASEIKTSIPYISSVTNHWFRNVYFEGTSSVGANGSIQVGVDEDEDGLEDFNETSGEKTQKTRSLTSDDDVYTFGDETSAEMEYKGDPIEGVEGKITFKGNMAKGVVQNKDAVRGITNATTKELFSKKYYIYDGTIATAKRIQQARASHDDSIKQNIQFTKDSLSAFTILENSETLDSKFIYRDLKELVIELGYFEREDFDEIEKQVLEWPIPDYIPGDWPDRKIEKQVTEYGTLIACDETVAASVGISLEDLRKMTKTDEDDEEEKEEEDYKNILKTCTFLGDAYIQGLKDNVDLEDAKFFATNNATAQYWINNIASLPETVGKFVIYVGINDPSEYQASMNLIDALLEKYDGTSIYFIEVMHVAKSCQNADEINKQIDTYNSHLREKCKVTKGATFIDASSGFISQGYLARSDSTGTIIPSSDYEKWAKNIAYAIKDRRAISTNTTDEQFVVDFLTKAKELTNYAKENGFTSGTPETIPPKSSENKVMSGDKMVAWTLYEAGYTDQPEDGLSVGDNGDFIEYCESKEWERITDSEEVQAGDIVFEGSLDSDGKKARKVYICAGDGKAYDWGGSGSLTLEQPVNKSIGSDFVCAYRVTGDGVINAGFKEDLDVMAMGNGRVIEILNENNNLFTNEGLSQQLYGEGMNQGEDEVEGRVQSYDGVKIKLTDNALRGYTLVMYGFQLEGLSEGQDIQVGDVIGKTLNSDICLILIDRDKGIVEDIENYIKVPKKVSDGSATTEQPYKPEEGDDIILANMMHHEGCTNTFQSSAYGSYSKDEADRINMTTGYVLLNRAIINYEGYGKTIREQLRAPGQYATAYAADSTEIECLECYANAKLCLTYDCNYVKNPKGVEMTRDVLGQSGWCFCDNPTPGAGCFWWVDDNRNGIADEYSSGGGWYDEFFCYIKKYESYR